jgi:SAM-dependent methyltransferase
VVIVSTVDATEKLRGFGQVFDDVAAAYDEVRPSYPAGLVDAALERGRLGAGSRVLEVGCGTGKLTELLAARGLIVDAVDPGPNMLEAARTRVGPTNDVRFHLGRFEDVSLPESAFAAVFSATAFHWLDPAVAWRKAASHLEPRGLLALLTHIGVRAEHTDDGEEEFIALLGKYAPEIAEGVPWLRDLDTITAGIEQRRDNASEVWDWVMSEYHGLAVAEAAALFDDVEVTTDVSVIEQTADEIAAHFRTTSLYFRIDPALRQAFEDDDRRLIERHGGTLQFSQAAVLMTARRS